MAKPPHNDNRNAPRTVEVNLAAPEPPTPEAINAARQEQIATIRAHFAASAMTGILSRPASRAGGHAPAEVARESVEYGDALLDALYPVVDDGDAAVAAAAETIAE